MMKSGSWPGSTPAPASARVDCARTSSRRLARPGAASAEATRGWWRRPGATPCAAALHRKTEAIHAAGVLHSERPGGAPIDLESIPTGELVHRQLQPLPTVVPHLLAPGQVEQPLEI